MSIGAIALLVTLVTAAAFTLFGVLYAGRQHIDLEGYMVNRNQVGGWSALATVTASALGAWILFSPQEAGSAFGGVSAILGYCLGSAGAVALFFVVGPRLRHLMPQGHSLNEYVKYRFGGPMYWLVEAVIVFYMFIYLSAELTAIAKALQLVADVPLGVTALVVITAVFIYTTVGGLGTTILTDVVQFVVIVPLLLICAGVIVVALGGSDAFGAVVAQQPELLSLGNISGIRFGATLMIAIVAAEVFNQGNWQRVYACRDSQTVRRAFLGSAVIILPLIFIAGLLGVLAVPLAEVQPDIIGETALFGLLNQLAMPGWVVVSVIVLALALVMSSLDTMLNGIASVFTLDLIRVLPDPSANNVLRVSRILTVLVGVPAIAIAAQGYSVLYLFFVADLICAAVLFPMLYGLYSRHLTGVNAFVSSVVGMVVGLLFFQKPDFAPLFSAVPGSADLLHSFTAALITSTVVTLVWTTLAKQQGTAQVFNYDELKTQAYSSSTDESLPA
ncbi:sodium-solute symporter [Leptolyngbya sp. Heron Island J]|uniref:sodium:solute symporter family transporter n=1 Tax=Leptolyngbya sp. Heron Island J TaxID=1385935 RepID=UPI0003B99479|nr:sodium:solute symporter [Leptolyngbya sp. Heron Island J]ESA34824.1 sodium-solute symporter [Leptolyngbya sp. Heron Island J]